VGTTEVLQLEDNEKLLFTFLAGGGKRG